MNKIPFKDKKRVSIFLSQEKEREFKMKALEVGVSLSQYLEAAGTVTPKNKISQFLSHCTHTQASYIGHKSCCSKCGGLYEAGMGESWEIQEIESRDQTDAK